MRIFTLKIVYLFLCLGVFPNLHAQSLVDDANLSMAATGGENTFTETIKVISNSKKIFVLTNNNQQMGPGDFISLAIDDKLAARAVVAKNHQGQTGIKILKIYSLAQWGKLQRDMDVLVIKGDDSMFGKKPEPPPVDDSNKIKSEDDLYTGDVMVDDDLDMMNENKNRHIKPDNIISAAGGFYNVDEIKAKGGQVRAIEFNFAWAFQFTDNFFLEGLYGRATLKDYPGDGAQTYINNMTVRLKYNFKGPLYTYFMPYVGYQTKSVSSPDAGKNTVDTSLNDQELEAIDNLKKSGPVAGVTILRRLVPGWFIKADLGTDVMGAGFAIEF